MLSWATKRAEHDLGRFLPPDEAPTIREVVGAFCRYYQDVEYSKCVRENDGDMLLFQYGVYDWGRGPWFEVGMVRQFVVEAEDPDDSQMEQLQVNLFFLPAVGQGVSSFDLWSNATKDLDDFASRLRDTPGFHAVDRKPPARWEVLHELV